MESSSLSSTLTDTEQEFTVFAPSNDALVGATISDSSLRTHVLNEIVRGSGLRSGAIFFPLKNDTLLHVSEVYNLRSAEGYGEVRITSTYCNTII